jgi:hypothetical protein
LLFPCFFFKIFFIHVFWDFQFGAQKGFGKCVCVWNFNLQQNTGLENEWMTLCVWVCVYVFWELQFETRKGFEKRL